MNTRRVEDMEDEDVQNFIKEWSLKGQLCFPNRKTSGEWCKEMNVSLRDGVLALNDSEKLMEYVNEFADGTLRTIASANRNVSLYTATTGIRFRRGTPQVLAMPAELRLPERQRKTPKVFMSDEPSITVELPEYELAAMPEVTGMAAPTAMHLHLAPLLEDPGFLAGWLYSRTRTRPLDSSDGNFTESCEQSPGLRRFRACGGPRENGGDSVSIELDPWRPSRDDLVVKIGPRPELQEVFHPLEVPVKVVTVNGEEPLQWLIRRSCVTDADETLYTPKAVGELAACCSTRRAIEKVRSFLTKYADVAEQVAAVLIRVDDNPNISRILPELSDSIPAVALPQLARMNASEATLLAACRNAGELDLPAILGQVPEERLGGLQQCIDDRDFDTLLARSVFISCVPCARAVGRAFKDAAVKDTFEEPLRTGQSPKAPSRLVKGNQSLVFTGKKLADLEQVRALTAGIGEMKNLRQLRLASNRLGPEGHLAGVEALGAALGRMTELTRLDLADNDLGEPPGAATGLGWALAKLTKLTSLKLRSNLLGRHPGDVEDLGAALPSMASLTELDLSFNALGRHQADAMALAAALGHTTGLTELDLSENDLGKHAGDAEALGEALAKMTGLTKLDLSDNGLGEQPGAAEALGRALARMTSLTELRLRGNDLGRHPGAVEVLSAALAKMPKLTFLNLQSNQLGRHQGAVEALAAALAKTTSLTYLQVWDNDLEREDEQDLQEALPEGARLGT